MINKCLGGQEQLADEIPEDALFDIGNFAGYLERVYGLTGLERSNYVQNLRQTPGEIFLENPRNFKEILENSRKSRKILEFSRIFSDFLGFSRNF